MCERSVGAVTRHHVVPRSEGGRDTVWLCRACHLQLHACFTNETLAAELGSLERLRSDPVVERYLHWIRRQQDGRVLVAQEPAPALTTAENLRHGPVLSPGPRKQGELRRTWE